MGLEKAQVQQIIKQAVSRQITIRQAMEEAGVSGNQFYQARKKYNIPIPDYKIKRTCICGKPVLTKRFSSHGFCEKCRKIRDAEIGKKWRKKHPDYYRNRTKTLYMESESWQTVDGWTYNAKKTAHYKKCERCNSKRPLNRFGLCQSCYQVESNNLADTEMPFYQPGKHHEPLSERKISVVPWGVP